MAMMGQRDKENNILVFNFELDWIGLDWIGLDWIDWMDWIGCIRLKKKAGCFQVSL